MTFTTQILNTPSHSSDTLITGVYEGNKLSDKALEIDSAYGSIISHHVENHKKFKGKAGQTLVITLQKNSEYLRVLLIGLGKANKLDEKEAEKIGTIIHGALSALGSENAVMFIENNAAREKISTADLAAYIGFGASLKSYTFDKYLSKKDKSCCNADNSSCDNEQADKDDCDDNKDINTALEIIIEEFANGQASLEKLNAVSSGVKFARDLINEPPNKLYPESYAQMVKDELKPLGVNVEIIDEKKLKKLGFEAHLAVGRGSVNKPYAVVLEWNGTGKDGDEKPLAFVGKGVTFDTGGINIKPSAGMEAMKIDMGGSAAVVGLFKTLAVRKAKTNVVGIIGLAENMPSANAYLPSDIIDSLSGKTIEVLNTDAEGRLVLADCMTYIQNTYDPKLMIDLATLTGAILVALGHEYAGTFVNDEQLWEQLENSSKRSGEKLWRMPLDPAFSKEMKSPIADLKNLGNGRYAGASTAAAFLEYFVDKDRKWAHIDIAGMTMNTKDKKARVSFGVRVLNDFVASYYEK